MIIINKADKENIKEAEIARSEFKNALHLYSLKDNSWQPKVMTCSAIENTGIDETWQIISDFIKITKGNGSFDKNRTVQNKSWLIKTIDQQLKDHFYTNLEVKKNLKRIVNKVENNEISPFEAANELIEIYFNKKEGK